MARTTRQTRFSSYRQRLNTLAGIWGFQIHWNQSNGMATGRVFIGPVEQTNGELTPGEIHTWLEAHRNG